MMLLESLGLIAFLISLLRIFYLLVVIKHGTPHHKFLNGFCLGFDSYEYLSNLHVDNIVLVVEFFFIITIFIFIFICLKLLKRLCSFAVIIVGITLTSLNFNFNSFINEIYFKYKFYI